MEARLLVGSVPINGCASGLGFSCAVTDSQPWSWSWSLHLDRVTRFHHPRWNPVLVNASSVFNNPEQNHYSVLGVARTAASRDIKKAYRLLSRKFHPDVNKDSQAGEIFKRIHRAYQVLSDEGTRNQYDRALKYEEDAGRPYRRKWDYSSDYEADKVRIYRWSKLRRKMKYARYWERNDDDEEEEEEKNPSGVETERGPFSQVLGHGVLLLFLLRTFGSMVSLTFSSLAALLDEKLDAGYKLGYIIAWILGGRDGILLTLCLLFASWACGKTSSSMVALVVIAMWVGSNMARFAPFPQGAVLTLLYMSIKLQADLK